MKSQSTLLAPEVSFLQNMPLPVLYGMRMAILSGNDASMVPTLAGLAANEWMAAMMKDVISRYNQIFSALNDVQNNSTDNPGSGAAGTMCNLSVTSTTTRENIKVLTDNAEVLGRVINDDLAKQIRDFHVADSMAQQLDELNNKLNTQLQRAFGPSVAYRMMQKIKQNSRG